MSYSFLLKDGTTYNLPAGLFEKTLQPGKIKIPVDSGTTENTFRPGGAEIGERRQKTMKYKLSGVMSRPPVEKIVENGVPRPATRKEQVASIRDEINGLFNALYNIDYLVDNDMDMRLKVSLGEGNAISFEEGSYLRFGKVDLEFIGITPYWESLVVKTYTQDLVKGKTNTIPSGQFILKGINGVLPVINLTLKPWETFCNKIIIFDKNSNFYLRLGGRNAFPRPFRQLVIDCENGVCYNKATGIFHDTDMSDLLSDNSSFINMNQGQQDWDIVVASDMTLSVDYREYSVV